MKVDDTISRQAAVDAMVNCLWHMPNKLYKNLNCYEFTKEVVAETLSEVPSPPPSERECAEWIYNGDICVCSACDEVPVNKIIYRGDTVIDYAMRGCVTETLKFCPNCGAPMKMKKGGE